MWQNDKVGAQSMKMLKVRAALEEKLKQKGLLGSITPKTEKAKKIMKPLNRSCFAPMLFGLCYGCFFILIQPTWK